MHYKDLNTEHNDINLLCLFKFTLAQESVRNNMANNSTHLISISSEVLLFSVLLKFIAMGIGVTGNAAVIIYNIFMLKERTATSYLVANLALADLLICLTFYPIWIVEFILTILKIDSDQDLFCKMSRSTIYALMFASVATLLAVTIDRYLFIVKPLKYPMIVTRRRIILVVLGIWLTASGLLFAWQMYWRKSPDGLPRSLCRVVEDSSYILISFSLYLPLILIFVVNFQILKVAQQQRRRILAEGNIVGQVGEQSPKPRDTSAIRVFQASKAAKTFFIVVVVLAFCFLIPAVVGTVLFHSPYDTSYMHIWYAVVHFELGGINSIVNPFIYGARHIKYRKAYRNILFKFLRCKLFTKETDSS